MYIVSEMNLFENVKKAKNKIILASVFYNLRVNPRVSRDVPDKGDTV